MAIWIKTTSGKIYGPVTPSELKGLADSNKLPRNVMLSTDGKVWRLAHTVKGLFSREQEEPSARSGDRAPELQNGRENNRDVSVAATDATGSGEDRTSTSAKEPSEAAPNSHDDPKSDCDSTISIAHAKSIGEKQTAVKQKQSVAILALLIVCLIGGLYAKHLFKDTSPPTSTNASEGSGRGINSVSLLSLGRFNIAIPSNWGKLPQNEPSKSSLILKTYGITDQVALTIQESPLRGGVTPGVPRTVGEAWCSRSAESHPAALLQDVSFDPTYYEEGGDAICVLRARKTASVVPKIFFIFRCRSEAECYSLAYGGISDSEDPRIPAELDAIMKSWNYTAEPISPRFAWTERGVSDSQTGLVWDHEDNGNDISMHVANVMCRAKGSGWKLPTPSELVSLSASDAMEGLVAEGSTRLPLPDSKDNLKKRAIATGLIRISNGTHFWTSDPNRLVRMSSPPEIADSTWNELRHIMSPGGRALCVYDKDTRDVGQSNSNDGLEVASARRFVRSESGIVRDSLTGIDWLNVKPPRPSNFADGSDECSKQGPEWQLATVQLLDGIFDGDDKYIRIIADQAHTTYLFDPELAFDLEAKVILTANFRNGKELVYVFSGFALEPTGLDAPVERGMVDEVDGATRTLAHILCWRRGPDSRAIPEWQSGRTRVAEWEYRIVLKGLWPYVNGSEDRLLEIVYSELRRAEKERRTGTDVTAIASDVMALLIAEFVRDERRFVLPPRLIQELNRRLNALIERGIFFDWNGSRRNLRRLLAVSVDADVGGFGSPPDFSLETEVGRALTRSPTVEASFDCERASTAVERSICDDEELRRLDGEMGRLYRQVQRSNPGLREGQIAWIRGRNEECGADESCLKRMTRERLSALNGMVADGGVSSDRNAQNGIGPEQMTCTKIPRYPPAMLRRGIKGEVLIRIEFGYDGRVSNASVEKSSGHREFDRSALDAARACRFKGSFGGETALVPFTFSLAD